MPFNLMFNQGASSGDAEKANSPTEGPNLLTQDTHSTRIKELVRPPSSAMGEARANLTGQRFDGGKNTEIFPEDLGSHFMAFMFHRFNYTNDNLAKEQKFLRTILLPVPVNLQEQIQTQYNTPELGAVQGEISDAISRTGKNAAEGGIIDKLSSFLGDAGDLAGDIVTGNLTAALGGLNEGTGGDANRFTQAAAMAFRGGQGAVAAGVNRFFASAPNPHITALFQGVGLRTHNFSWKLSPRKAEESGALARIIQQFRGSMLPIRRAGNLTLGFPDEVDIYIGGTQDGYLYHFKRAVIRNMTTNFAPDGVPSFFASHGGPTAVTINLDLLETTVHTRRDYEEGVPYPAFTTIYSGDQPQAEQERHPPNFEPNFLLPGS